MIELNSSLIHRESRYDEVTEVLESCKFVLGGDWDYNYGSFDQALDAEDKVWLRLPFTVVDGRLDSENPHGGVTIRWEQPYVLKHLYNEGNSSEADATLLGGLVNQFQSPTDPDASVEPHWQEEGQKRLREAESAMSSAGII